MVHDFLIAHIATPGNAVSFGTRNGQLQPLVGRGVAAIVSADKSHLTLITTESVFKMHEKNLKDNGEISVNITFPPTHTSFQLKGTYTSHIAADEKTVTLARTNLAAFEQILAQWYGPDAAKNVSKYLEEKLVAVTLAVKEMFNQTPGPNAGAVVTEKSNAPQTNH